MTAQPGTDDKSQAIPARLPAPAQDLMNDLFRGQHDGQIRCILTLQGRLDAGRMARSVRLTLDAEPVLGCRWVERSWRPYWERCDDLDHQATCALVESHNAPALESELWRFVVAPMEVRSGPPVQTRIFRGNGDTLCVKVHHAAADGSGAIQYVGLLAQMYRQLAVNPNYRPRPNLASRGLGPIYKRVGPLGLLAGLRHIGTEDASWGFPMTGGVRSGLAFGIRRVGPERLRAVKSYGHLRGATMNDILLAAFYRALFEIVDPPYGGRYIISVPFDLRRYLPAGQTLPICNHASNVQVAIARERGATFENTLMQVHPAMQALKSGFPGLGMSLLGEVLCLPGYAAARRMLTPFIERASASGRATPFFSNVGAIPAEVVSFGEVEVVDAVGLGMLAFPPAMILTASTYHEVLTLATGYCDAAIDRLTIERFLDALVNELPG